MSATISAIDAPSAQRVRRGVIPLSEVATANRQRDALYQLSEQLHRATTLQETYDAAMDAIESALNCDRSSILLFDEAGVMQFVASRGLSPGYRAAVTGHSPWQVSDTDATPIDVPDVAASALSADLKATVLGEGIRAAAFIPLVSDGALIGKFMAYFREPYEFSKDDLSVSLVIARQLAFAVQRNRVDQQLRAREAQLAEDLAAASRLQSLSLEMAGQADFDALHEKLLDASISIMHADFASIQQFYPHLGAHGELKLLAHRGFSPQAAQFWAWVKPNDSCMCAAAMSRRARVIAADVTAEPFIVGTTDEVQFREAGIRAV